MYGEITISSGLAKTLKGINGSNWHDTFLGIWIAALLLVQRVKLISYCLVSSLLGHQILHTLLGFLMLPKTHLVLS